MVESGTLTGPHGMRETTSEERLDQLSRTVGGWFAVSQASKSVVDAAGASGGSVTHSVGFHDSDARWYLPMPGPGTFVPCPVVTL